ncbi:MAG TPA: hypothetical protein VGB93_01330, partial [Methylovirgula sp.]
DQIGSALQSKKTLCCLSPEMPEIVIAIVNGRQVPRRAASTSEMRRKWQSTQQIAVAEYAMRFHDPLD